MSLDAQLAREQFQPECRRCKICGQFAYHKDDYRAARLEHAGACYVCKVRPESRLLKHHVTIASGEA